MGGDLENEFSNVLVQHRLVPTGNGTLIDLVGSEAEGYMGEAHALLDGRVAVVTAGGRVLLDDPAGWVDTPVDRDLCAPQDKILAVSRDGGVVVQRRDRIELRGAGIRRFFAHSRARPLPLDAVEKIQGHAELVSRLRRMIRPGVQLIVIDQSNQLEPHDPGSGWPHRVVALGPRLEVLPEVRDEHQSWAVPTAVAWPQGEGSRTPGPRPKVARLVGSPDGSGRFARARWVEVRDAEGKLLHRCFVPLVGARSAYAPDMVVLSARGDHLLVSSSGGAIQHHDLTTGVVDELRIPGANIEYAAFIRAETRILTSSSDGMVRVWYMDRHAVLEAAKRRGLPRLRPEEKALLPDVFPDAVAPTPPAEGGKNGKGLSGEQGTPAAPAGDPSK
jgi:hypothetical protein